jgi:hypothetical protein
MFQSVMGRSSAFAANVTTGAMLAETFSTYFANFGGFFILALVAHLPLLLQTAMPRQPVAPGHLYQTLLPVLLITVGLALVTNGLTSAAVTFGVLQHLRGRPTSIGTCLGQGFSSIGPVLLVVLLQSLICIACGVLCFIPLLFVWPIIAMAVPAAVEERPGVVAALGRSAFLTEGYRWVVFITLLALGILLALVGFVSSAGLTLVLRGSPATLKVALLVVQSVSGGLQATAVAVLYYRLRSAKEAIDVSHLASVFD